MSRKPRGLLFDIESSHNLGYFYDLKNNDYIPHGNIVVERHVFCIGYKWIGEKKINLISILDDPKRFKKDHHDDYYVLSEFKKVLEQADYLVYHHGDKFDMPMLNARFAYHGIEPVRKIPSIDTKKEASRHFRFNSNRLDYLARFLGYKGKMENPGGLWIDCFNGVESALKHMGKYCKQDIDINEFVFSRLAPFMQGHKVNTSAFLGGYRCPNVDCGGPNLISRGTTVTISGEYNRFQCTDCGRWTDERKVIKNSSIAKVK